MQKKFSFPPSWVSLKISNVAGLSRNQTSLDNAAPSTYAFDMSPNAQFILDQKGEKTSVILPLAEYEALLEDLADLVVIAERANEPTVPLDQVVANLKRDGLLQD